MLPNYDNSAACAAAQMRIPARFSRLQGGHAGRESLIAASVNLNVQISDLLPQGIAVEAEQVGGPDLIAPGRRQCGGEQRHFDLLEDPVIEAGRRHAVWET